MKQRYNIVLRDPSEQQTVLDIDCLGMEIYDELPMLNGVVCMMLTDDEAETLKSCEKIVGVEREDTDNIFEEALWSPRSQTSDYLTRYSLSSGFTGADHTSHFKFFSSDQEISPPGANTDGPLGFFNVRQGVNEPKEDAYVLDQTIEQNYAGEYVDIVAIEAGDPLSTNDIWVNHVDSQNQAGNATRFVEMDWDNHGTIFADANRQVTVGTTYFSDHAIGVLSAAAGKYCGWSKVSSMRVIYLGSSGDGVTSVYNAVLSWHQSKPINPATGRRNATITTGAWGYGGVDHDYAILVDDFTTITSYDKNGVETVVNRPGSSWGTDLTPFVDAGIAPRVLNDPDDSTDKWYIPIPDNFFDATFNATLQNYVDDGSIYHFKSAGNNAGVGVKYSDPRWNTRLTTEASITYINLAVVNSTYRFTSTNASSGPYTEYPLRSRTSSSSNCIIVGACQHSTSNTLPDDYSNRGPYVDIWAFGAYTWTSNPSNTLQDGLWGYFSGTSCAAPVMAGGASMFVEYHFDLTGEWPTNQQLLDYIQTSAREVLISDPVVDWSNVPAAGDYQSLKLYNSPNEVNRIKENDFANGGSDLSELWQSPTKRMFIPYWVTRNTKERFSSVTKKNFHYNNTESSRQIYPRRKIRVG